MQNNTQLVQSKISEFRQLLDDKPQNITEEICLHCRAIYGTLVQSLAWAATPQESDELFKLIPDSLELIVEGQTILNEHVKTHPADVTQRYLDSVTDKHDRLTKLQETRSLKHFVAERA